MPGAPKTPACFTGVPVGTGGDQGRQLGAAGPPHQVVGPQPVLARGTANRRAAEVGALVILGALRTAGVEPRGVGTLSGDGLVVGDGTVDRDGGRGATVEAAPGTGEMATGAGPVAGAVPGTGMGCVTAGG